LRGQSQEAKAAAIDFRGFAGEGAQRRFAVVACSLGQLELRAPARAVRRPPEGLR